MIASKPRIFVTRHLPGGALDRLRSVASVDLWTDEMPPPRDVLLERGRNADGLISLLTDRIDRELLDACPGLVAVANYAVGFDNIDVPACTAAGVFASNTPGVLTNTTADFAFALLMAGARRVAEGDRFTRAAKWKTWGPELLLGTDVYRGTLGLIGVGQIGAAVARRARGFEMRILYHDAMPRPDLEQELGLLPTAIEALLREADFVSLHVPLTPQTHHLIGDRELGMMKETAVLVNTSRGPVVDGEALYRALKSGRPAAAALDVTEAEPISPDDPLLSLENVTVAPHIASGSSVTRARMAEMAVENVLAGLAGQTPTNCLNPEVAGHQRSRRD